MGRAPVELTVNRRRPWNFGGTDVEVSAHYPCDDWTTSPARALIRAVEVAAPTDLVYRWLCQIQVAPYSYDWIDHLGRRSPRELTSGADQIRVGQNFQVTKVVAVEAGVHITGSAEPGPKRLFGVLAMSYTVAPSGTGSRIVVRLTVENRPGVLRRIRRLVLGWGDLVMMRRQLTNIRGLAERDALAAAQP